MARGANPDKQDTNGNTVLHMLVIYEKVVGAIIEILASSEIFLKFSIEIQSGEKLVFWNEVPYRLTDP